MILVTGMHRSGTSFMCQLLAALGIDFGDPAAFYAADDWNEEGYFESRAVIDVDSRIVTGFARTAGRLERLASELRYLSMPGRAALDARAERRRDELERVAADHADLAVKDPRICLTLPYWRATGRVRATVVCLRHPIDVARSLQRRQRVPRAIGLAFWHYHLAAVLEACDAERTLFVDFDRMRGPERHAELAALCRFLGIAADEDARRDALERVFQGRLVHASAEEPETLPPRHDALWTAVRAAADASQERVRVDGGTP